MKAKSCRLTLKAESKGVLINLQNYIDKHFVSVRGDWGEGGRNQIKIFTKQGSGAHLKCETLSQGQPKSRQNEISYSNFKVTAMFITLPP